MRYRFTNWTPDGKQYSGLFRAPAFQEMYDYYLDRWEASLALQVRGTFIGAVAWTKTQRYTLLIGKTPFDVSQIANMAKVYSTALAYP